MAADLALHHGSPLLTQVGRLGELFDVLGAAVILAGAVFTVARSLTAWRRQGLLLGLEILIAADLLRSVALNLTLNSITTLGVLVIVRTILSFSVQIELEGELPWRLSASRTRGGPG